MTRVRVAFAGPAGRTGQATGSALDLLPDLEVVGAVSRSAAGRDLGELWHRKPDGRPIFPDTQAAIRELRPDVLVDFTVADAAERSMKAALVAGVRPVIGTTGLAAAQIREAQALSRQHSVSAAVIANFSIVSALLTEFSLRAAPYFSGVELIELHGPDKRDKPSGTALRLQTRLREEGQDEVPVHSVRLAGHVAHQEVLFGREGETLTLRHDAIDRSCYAAGVRLAALGVMQQTGFFLDLSAFLREP